MGARAWALYRGPPVLTTSLLVLVNRYNYSRGPIMFFIGATCCYSHSIELFGKLFTTGGALASRSHPHRSCTHSIFRTHQLTRSRAERARARSHIKGGKNLNRGEEQSVVYRLRVKDDPQKFSSIDQNSSKFSSK